MEAFILGAGFSREIGPSMPVLADLTNPLNNELDRLSGTSVAEFPPTRNVELLLSSLAVDQPFLDEAVNLRNRALFVDLRRWLAEHIFRAQQHTLGSPLPPWLQSLVTAWHEREATVITLNYDTLIESAVMSILLKSDADRVLPQHTYALPVEFSPAGSFDRYGKRRTFRLCKLHGSLSWFGRVSPPQVPKEVEVWKDTFNSETRASWEEIEERAVGIGEPFLVPPILVKSEHFDNSLVRANWTRAHAGLQRATTIIIMGYSFPSGDAQMAALLGTASRDKHIIIVDTNSDDVQARVADACSELSTITINAADSEHPIREFADQYAEKLD